MSTSAAEASGEYAIVLMHAGGSTEGMIEVSLDVTGRDHAGQRYRQLQEPGVPRLDVR